MFVQINEDIYNKTSIMSVKRIEHDEHDVERGYAYKKWAGLKEA